MNIVYYDIVGGRHFDSLSTGFDEVNVILSWTKDGHTSH